MVVCILDLLWFSLMWLILWLIMLCILLFEVMFIRFEYMCMQLLVIVQVLIFLVRQILKFRFRLFLLVRFLVILVRCWVYGLLVGVILFFLFMQMQDWLVVLVMFWLDRVRVWLVFRLVLDSCLRLRVEVVLVVRQVMVSRVVEDDFFIRVEFYVIVGVVGFFVGVGWVWLVGSLLFVLYCCDVWCCFFDVMF